jgi:hypothetical protein
MQGAIITITLAKQHSVLPVVVSSPFTCQFNVLTATHLYSLYPKLLMRRETVRGMALTWSAETQRLALRGVRVVKPNEKWTVPCDEACLPVWRRTDTLDGVGVMQWAGYNGTQNIEESRLLTLTDDFELSNYKWRLGVHCSNPACQNSMNSTLI